MSCDHAKASKNFGWCPSCEEPYDRRLFCPQCHSQVSPSWPQCHHCRAKPFGGLWQTLPWQLTSRLLLQCQLDRGGQGAVYAAQVADFEGYQAVKVAVQAGSMPPAAVKELRERFKRECWLQGSLENYESIIKARETGITPNGIPFLVMELIQGPTLHVFLGARPDPEALNPTRGVPLDPLLAIRILSGLAQAVDCMHFRRIIHRDIKPGNIFLSKNSTGNEMVKLGDLGLAWAMERGGGRSPDPLPNGSPLYMSPEQVLCAKNQGPPSDIYSIGVVGYEMLTGRMPYDITEELIHQDLKVGKFDIKPELRGRFFAGWLKAHVYAQLVPPEQANSDLAPEVCQLLTDCLCRSPEHRIGTARELLSRLDAVETELASSRKELQAGLDLSRRRAAESVELLEQFYARVRPAMDYIAGARGRLNQLFSDMDLKQGSLKALSSTSDALSRLAVENLDLLEYLDQGNERARQVTSLSLERQLLLTERDQLLLEKGELSQTVDQLAERVRSITTKYDRLAAHSPEAKKQLDNTTTAKELEFHPASLRAAPPSPSNGPSSVLPHPRLVCVSSNFLGKEWILNKIDLIAGRKGQEICLDHDTVSSTHARFFLDGGQWMVEDLGSRNGVWINGRRFGKAPLRAGDVVDLGHVRLRFVAANEDFVFSRDASDLIVVSD